MKVVGSIVIAIGLLLIIAALFLQSAQGNDIKILKDRVNLITWGLLAGLIGIWIMFWEAIIFD